MPEQAVPSKTETRGGGSLQASASEQDCHRSMPGQAHEGVAKPHDSSSGSRGVLPGGDSDQEGFVMSHGRIGAYGTDVRGHNPRPMLLLLETY